MKTIIKCPKCDWEYLPGEIYLPNQFLGQPKEIERTIDGKILDYEGVEQDTEELFYCEHCYKPFKIHATINFTTEYKNNLDFDEEYSTPLYNNRINLKEN